MKKIILLVLITTFIITCNPALSEELHKYIGFGMGQSSFNVSDVGADEIEDTNISLKIFGGIEFYPNFIAEIGYINFGNYSAHYPLFDETDTAHGEAFFATIIGQTEVIKKVSLFGKLGLAYSNMDYKVDAIYMGSPIYEKGNGTGINFLCGLGVNYEVDDVISVRAGWEQYNDVGGDIDITVAGVGPVKLNGEDIEIIDLALIFNF